MRIFFYFDQGWVGGIIHGLTGAIREGRLNFDIVCSRIDFWVDGGYFSLEV